MRENGPRTLVCPHKSWVRTQGTCITYCLVLYEHDLAIKVIISLIAVNNYVISRRCPYHPSAQFASRSNQKKAGPYRLVCLIWLTHLTKFSFETTQALGYTRYRCYMRFLGHQAEQGSSWCPCSPPGRLSSRRMPLRMGTPGVVVSSRLSFQNN
jgi:hypothetical protein